MRFYPLTPNFRLLKCLIRGYHKVDEDCGPNPLWVACKTCYAFGNTRTKKWHVSWYFIHGIPGKGPRK